VKIAPRDQLLDQEPRHDGLPGAGVVSQEESQRLAGEHVAVNGGDLMGQGLD
jgi:hypothetical protein